MNHLQFQRSLDLVQSHCLLSGFLSFFYLLHWCPKPKSTIDLHTFYTNVNVSSSGLPQFVLAPVCGAAYWLVSNIWWLAGAGASWVVENPSHKAGTAIAIALALEVLRQLGVQR